METNQATSKIQDVSIAPMHLCDTLEKLKKCIADNTARAKELKTIIKKDQSSQKEIVKQFQLSITDSLQKALPSFSWEAEHKIDANKLRDSIDIFGESNEYAIIIELDKPRADQVAKKMLSRMACHLYTPIIYIAVCYPGTKAMNPTECIKYFDFGRKLLKKIYPQSILIGCIINSELKIEFYDK